MRSWALKGSYPLASFALILYEMIPEIDVSKLNVRHGDYSQVYEKVREP